jgi:hypothetical protein
MYQLNRQLIISFLLLALTAFSVRLLQVTPTSYTSVALNTPQQYSQVANSENYFLATVPNPSSDKVLLITISSDIQNLVVIYVSTSASPDFRNGTFPTSTSFSQ